jgi:hypothetical protein
MRLLALLACTLVGCGSSGERLTGSLDAAFRGVAFSPSYGATVAGGLDATLHPLPQGMTLHLSTAEVGCDTDFTQGFPLGTYILVGLTDRQPGDHSGGAFVIEQFTRTATGFNEQLESSSTGQTTVLDVSADSVGATLTFTSGTTHANGTVRVHRCF